MCLAGSPRKATARVPMRVLRVSIPYLRSPSTSGRSFVMAMTVAKVMTEQVIKLHVRKYCYSAMHTSRVLCRLAVGSRDSSCHLWGFPERWGPRKG